MIKRLKSLNLLAWLTPLFMSLPLVQGIAQAQPAKVPPTAAPGTQLDEPGPNGSDPEDRPWTIGVSAERQTRAKALYQAGNRYLSSALFTAAAAKYRAALQYWDHPGIHYNLALALISLDQPVEAYQSIAAALRYGADALHPDEYRRALDYQRLLRRQLAKVEVVCNEPDAVVTLDGKLLFTGPDRMTTLISPGKHHLVASKARYITTSQAVSLTAGSSTKVELHLVTEHQATSRVRRWPLWTPWFVVGTGIGLGAVGTRLHWQSSINTLRANEQLAIKCPTGCDPGDLEPLRPLYEQARKQRNYAYTSYGTSGALLLIGVLLVHLNHPRTVESKALRELVQISLHPGGPGGSTGFSLHIPF